MRTDMKAAAEIGRQLQVSEAIIWSGMPKQGLLLRRGDLLLVPFSFDVSVCRVGSVIVRYSVYAYSSKQTQAATRRQPAGVADRTRGHRTGRDASRDA